MEDCGMIIKIVSANERILVGLKEILGMGCKGFFYFRRMEDEIRNIKANSKTM